MPPANWRRKSVIRPSELYRYTPIDILLMQPRHQIALASAPCTPGGCARRALFPRCAERRALGGLLPAAAILAAWPIRLRGRRADIIEYKVGALTDTPRQVQAEP
jgi:hypothetical protein